MTLVHAELLVPVSRLRTQETGLFEEHREHIDKVIDWIDNYLCQPHPELGRPGPVCPFVPTALEKDLIQMVLYSDPYLDVNSLASILLEERDRFLELPPTKGNNAQFKATLILLPNLPKEDANQLVEQVQEKLRYEFAPHGLMLGEFHPGPPQKPGLWNETFRPLKCPVAMMAIRHMVPTDILFLKDERSLVAEYLKHFGDMVPAKFVKYIEEAAERFGFDLPERNPSTSSAPAVIYQLEKQRMAYKVHRHARCEKEIRTPQDFATSLGYEVDRISKAVLLREKRGSRYLIAVLPADKQWNVSLLEQHFAMQDLVVASDEEIKRRVGHPPSAITPIGVELPSVVDQSLMKYATILTGAGVKRMEIELAPQSLLALSGAEVLAFSQ